jgi:hypothetical protein
VGGTIGKCGCGFTRGCGDGSERVILKARKIGSQAGAVKEKWGDSPVLISGKTKGGARGINQKNGENANIGV